MIARTPIRSITLASLLALAAPCAPAQTAQYAIAGVVVNAQTGAPVAHANVAVLSSDDNHSLMSVTADPSGHFLLPGLPAAKYQLTASHRGYHTGFFNQHGDFSSAIVTGPNQDTAHLVFRLAPDAVLYGVVRDDAGDPVVSAHVLLFRKPTSATDRIAQAGDALTDDTGVYEFGELEPGQYLLAVKATPWYALHPAPGHTANSQLDVAYPITYYDSTTDEAGATPLQLAIGARVEANLTLQAVPALHLQVAVPRSQQGALARPELRQLVFGSTISAESSGFLDAAATGSTEFTGVAPGRYELQQGDPLRQAQLDATTSGSVDPNQGTPLIDVSGQLHAASGSALPADISVELTPTGSASNTQPVFTTAHNGAFHFQSPAGSQWQIAVSSTSQPAADLTVLAVSADRQTQPGGRFAVDAQPLALTVEISSTAASITGFAHKDGKPFTGAMIVLLPRAHAAQNPQSYAALVRRDQSDSDGSFSLRDAVPGAYTVLAIDNGWDLDWSDPALMSRYTAAGVAVTIPPDADKTISLSGPVNVESP